MNVTPGRIVLLNGGLVDYAAFTLIAVVARAAAGSLVLRISSVVATPIIFYMISNFGVWLGSERLYPHTLQGLTDCYVAALPFFRGTLVGDWLFAGTGMLAIEGLPRVRGLRTFAANFVT